MTAGTTGVSLFFIHLTFLKYGIVSKNRLTGFEMKQNKGITKPLRSCLRHLIFYGGVVLMNLYTEKLLFFH